MKAQGFLISFLHEMGLCRAARVYSRSPKVGSPIASILKSNVYGIPALFDLYPVSNFIGFTLWDSTATFGFGWQTGGLLGPL